MNDNNSFINDIHVDDWMYIIPIGIKCGLNMFNMFGDFFTDNVIRV